MIGTLEADRGMRNMVFDMSTVPDWNGTIDQLRFDPSASPSTTVVVDGMTLEHPRLVDVTFDGTADNVYTLYVDGTEIDTSGDWATVTTVISTLEPGDHTVAVRATDQGSLAMMQLRAMNEQGTVLLVSNTTDWVSFDATTIEPIDWTTVGYDDSGWNTPISCGLDGSTPWGNVIAGAEFIWDGADCFSSGTRLFRARLSVP